MRCTPRITFKDAHMILRTRERMPGAVTGSSLWFWPVEQELSSILHYSHIIHITVKSSNHTTTIYAFSLTSSRILVQMPICSAIGKLHLIQVYYLRWMKPQILLDFCQSHLEGRTATVVVLLLQLLNSAICQLEARLGDKFEKLTDWSFNAC